MEEIEVIKLPQRPPRVPKKRNSFPKNPTASSASKSKKTKTSKPVRAPRNIGNGDIRKQRNRDMRMQIADRVISHKISKEVQKLLNMLMNPIDAKLQRWPQIGNKQETTMAKPKDLRPVKWPNATVDQGKQVLAAGEMIFVLLRNPYLATITYDANSEGAAYAYQAFAEGLDTSIPAETYKHYIDAKLGYDAKHAFWRADATFTYQPHTDTIYSIKFKERPNLRFLWVESDTTITWFGTTPSDPDFVYLPNLKVWKWTPDTGVIKATEVSAPANIGDATTFELQIIFQSTSGQRQIGAYLAFSFDCTYSASSSVKAKTRIQSEANLVQWTTRNFTIVESTVKGSVFCHRPAKDLQTEENSIDSVRVPACSIRYGNRTNDFVINGSCYALQLRKDRNWMNYIRKLDDFVTQNGTKEFFAKTGIYGFLMPDTNNDLQMENNLRMDERGIVDCFIPLQDLQTAVVYCEVAQSTSFSAVFESCHVLEWETNSQMLFRGTPHIPVSAATEAVQSIGDFQQWYENPLHWKKIASKVLNAGKSIANGVNKALPYIDTGLNFANNIMDAFA